LASWTLDETGRAREAVALKSAPEKRRTEPMANQGTQQVPIGEAMRMAIDHHQAARLQQAEIIYKAVLESEPEHAGARYNLALIALQSGRPGEAVPVLKAALEADQDNEAHWLNYATALAGSGAPQAAHRVLLQARGRGLGGKALPGLLAQVERMLRSGGAATVVETLVGSDAVGSRAPNEAALQQMFNAGRFAEVEAQARALQAEFPDSAALAHLLGATLLAQNRFEAAREALEQASEAIPGDARIHQLIGLALRRLRRNDQAREAFERSLRIAPDNVETLLNASANAVTLGDAADARRYAEQAMTLRPDDVNVLRVMADAAALGGSFEEAADLYRRGIGLDPNAVDLHVNLGDALTNLGRTDEAIAEIEHALALQPQHPQAHLCLGRAYYRLGETAAACEHFRSATELAPDMPEGHTAYLFCLMHDERVRPEHVFREHQRIGELIEAPLQSARRPHGNDRDPERPLNVGFVSADLRDHAVAYLIEPVWKAMRGGRHRIVAYASQRGEDDVSRRLRALTDDWVRVERLDDASLAERIRADGIDILFDLSGHTSGNRLPVFARKPAPVQVSWIGYPGTTGLTTMDYCFIRGLEDKLGAMEPWFTEKLVCFRYRGFEPEPTAPPVNALPALAGGRITFASFNRPSKIGDAAVDLWSRVLREIPDSTLMIGAAGEARTQQRLRALFEARGVDAQRLTFRARTSLTEYLAMHHEVDIALDSFPYSGGTTTSHALWMGVPVLTLGGSSLQQNQTSVILGMMQLYDWIAHDEDDFLRKAQAAVADLDALSRLRQMLRPAMAEAFQGASREVGREMEAALSAIWRRWCAGLAPASFTVAL
jgi:predicted O-linked N-acetylglucosamine transferase (SPINDLY family)